MARLSRAIHTVLRAVLATAIVASGSPASAREPDGGAEWSRGLSSRGQAFVRSTSAASQARRLAIPRLAVSAFPRINQELRASMAAMPGRYMGEMGRAYLIIVTAMVAMSAIELQKQGGSVASGDLPAAVAMAATQTLDSVQIPMAVATFLAAHGLLNAASACLFAESLRGPSLRASFLRFVTSQANMMAAGTLAAVVANLAEETAWLAAERTGRPEDFERAKKPLTLFSGVARAAALGTEASARDRADVDLAAELVASYAYVLMTADGLRDWFSNAFRTSIATGEFLAGLVAMAPALPAGNAAAAAARAAVGAAVGAGAAATLAQAVAIGLTFAVVYSVIPESTKQEVTRRIQVARGWANGQRILRTGLDLRAEMNRPRVDPSRSDARASALLAERLAARDGLLTAAIERARDAIKQWTASARSEAAARAARATIADAQEQTARWLDLDVAELRSLREQATRAGLASAFAALGRQIAVAQSTREYVDGLFEAASALTSATEDELRGEDAMGVAAELEATYRRGFDSFAALRAAQSSAQERPAI